MKPALLRTLGFTAGLVMAISVSLLIERTRADARPAIELRLAQSVPRAVDETVQQAVVRDYSAAWQALHVALVNNNAAALNDNFVGFALNKLARRVQDQQQAGLKTSIVDRGHKVDVVFYSPDGAAIELSDTATFDTEILDGKTVIHSDRAQIHYFAVMTGAEDRWKVRVLESAK